MNKYWGKSLGINLLYDNYLPLWCFKYNSPYYNKGSIKQIDTYYYSEILDCIDLNLLSFDLSKYKDLIENTKAKDHPKGLKYLIKEINVWK